MGAAPFSRAGRAGVEAVRPDSRQATAHGLSQLGDTGVHEKLWRGEEAQSGEMQIETDTHDRSHGTGAGDVSLGAELEAGSAHEEQEDEEAGEVKTRRAPKGPTKKEREEHEATHIPYRDWCKHCVRGRAPNRQHSSKTKEDEETEQRKVPRISMDYFFMAQDGERAAEYPMIVMIDESTDNRYMRAVGKKGLGDNSDMEWLIVDMNEELKSWGYTGGSYEELIFKSDGERSIKAVRDALGKFHGGKITPEQPPPGESQENGRVEEAGKTLRGYLKVFKDMLEERSGKQIPTDAVLLQWLVRWVAMLHSRYRRGSDGKTAYERQRGRKCRLEVIPFGEFVHYRKLIADENKNKLESKWEDGIWLGHARGSSEVLIGTPEGVVRARTFKRRPEDERWNAEAMLSMTGTPAKPNPQAPGHDIPVHIRIQVPEVGEVPGEPAPARVETEPRRTYLKARDFHKHGWTESCEGCRRLKAGNMGARPHNEACRQRMEAILKAEGDPRWMRAKDRADERVWEEIQRQAAEEEAEALKAKGKKRRTETTWEAKEDVERDKNSGQTQSVDPPNSGTSSGSHTKSQEKRKPQEPTGGVVEQEDKRLKTETSQGTKRENPDATGEEDEDRHRPRRRTDIDPMNTDVIQSLMQVDIAEAYSPPRVTEQAKRYGLIAGEAMDITTGWDFTKECDRQRARDYLESEKPRLLIGSPMCTMFSPLQRMTPWNQQKHQRWREHRRHIEFVVDLYKKQMSEGRLFLHEHPERATSWRLGAIASLSETDGVYIVKTDQCMFGLATRGKRWGQVSAARKPTKFMTNSYNIARELERPCDGTHSHQALLDGRAKAAERYPPALCRAICRGLTKEVQNHVQHLNAVVEVSAPVAKTALANPEEFHESMEQEFRKLAEWNGGGACDDVTGMPLDRQKVQKARAEEIEYVRSKNVWTKIPRSEAQRLGYKVIKTRWIDINKGDDQNPVYRSRFVAKEFNTGDAQGLFAGTPPLEALRYLIHDAATKGPERKVAMINDVARAFFEARTLRKVCVELPDEALSDNDVGKDLVGFLNMSLYGTRDAAKNWQEEVAAMMRSWGFAQGKYNPCLYHHPAWKISTLVHGDDLVSTGGCENMKKFRKVLEKRFKIKTQVVGDGEGDELVEARVLNRILRVTPAGWEYEPDQRHTDMLIEGLGLSQARSVTSPGEEEKKWEEEENAVLLEPDRAKNFRGHAARLNYLAPDRPDIAYSVKELCRSMAAPTVGAWKQLKRLVRYLIGKRRTVIKYPWQGVEMDVETYTDSDWAGCRKTGKSTSGGAVTIGEHFIKGWSTTQASITLSSAEAELVAMTKATAETMGIISMIKDLGHDMKGVVYADSSAALAIADRKGSGKLRHINIRVLWIQEKERREEVQLRKVRGTVNPADLMTKYLAASRINDLTRRLGQFTLEGRAEAALDLQRNLLACHR